MIIMVIMLTMVVVSFVAVVVKAIAVHMFKILAWLCFFLGAVVEIVVVFGRFHCHVQKTSTKPGFGACCSSRHY